ncbi:MAG: hypothetical protein ACTS4V_00880 [Candidatus Hodgkinia cicadicola]
MAFETMFQGRQDVSLVVVTPLGKFNRRFVWRALGARLVPSSRRHGIRERRSWGRNFVKKGNVRRTSEREKWF